MSGLTSDLRNQIRLLIDEVRREEISLKPDLLESSMPVTVELLLVLGRLTASGELSEDEREVWVDRYVVGRTLAEIGRSIGGISREGVRQIESRANRKILPLLEHVARDAIRDMEDAA